MLQGLQFEADDHPFGCRSLMKFEVRYISTSHLSLKGYPSPYRQQPKAIK
jgi:hypothetical protein